MLSPLRFHFDDERFSLPVRLGLLNSPGTQDLIVHILARDRYEVANYPNVTIPTNLEISARGKEEFEAFYATLFDLTVEKNPRAVVTEYAWSASTCDPCPGPALSESDFKILGGDVLGSTSPSGSSPFSSWSATVTRLHTRYGRENLGEDLVFRKAPPIAGGNERWGGPNTQDAQMLSAGASNTFQGRYILRHPWEGTITCTNPRLGRWGGPPEGYKRPQIAKDLAFAPRGKGDLTAWIAQDVVALGVKASPQPPPQRIYQIPLSARFRGAHWPVGAGFFLGLAAVVALGWRSRRLS
ncbi:MAG: DUF2330 domain-containing protein, partial [Myxococcales bacterium]|nr:DUF2330 domain-containing protein [Polyangiaceae bacterium]MDW8251841.1 DUF2330 domain-containing protein [Myxococcales bacterium]